MVLLKCPDCKEVYSFELIRCPKCKCSRDNATFYYLPDDNDADPERWTFDKSERISYTNLKTMAISKVKPYLCRELGVSAADIQNNTTYPGVDLLVNNGNRKVGIKCLVEVLPEKNSFLYDAEAAGAMHQIGFAFAVIRISVSSQNDIRAERRAILDDDSISICYEPLRYFDYEKLSSVRYSLSADTSWRCIYERPTVSSSPYAITNSNETRKRYDRLFGQDFYDAIEILFKRYGIAKERKASLASYIDCLMVAMKFPLDMSETLLTFINCLDYCNGILFSDSIKINKKNIIKASLEFIRENTSTELDKYELFIFAYYIYHYITNDGQWAQNLWFKEMNELKVALFEAHPDYFGFSNLLEDRRKKKQINSNRNLHKMNIDIQTFVNSYYKRFIEINVHINSKGVFSPISFNPIIDEEEGMLKECNELMHFLRMSFDSTTITKGKERYTQYYKALSSFIDLLKMDIQMNKKLLVKANGGKYGFFEYRKEQKARNEKCNITVALINGLIEGFSIKEFPQNIQLLLDAALHLSERIKHKYETCIEANGDIGELKDELCNFHDYALTLPYSREDAGFRKVLLFTTEDFIELIEMKNSVSTDDYEDAEAELFNGLEIINDRVYEILV